MYHRKLTYLFYDIVYNFSWHIGDGLYFLMAYRGIINMAQKGYAPSVMAWWV